MGNSILAGRFSEKSESGGILIIDELEQHLHPRWQRLIVQRLRQQFPNTQFFSTTHTPLTASGITDVSTGTLTRFDRSLDNSTVATQLDRKKYEGIRADQWLASDAFGLVTTRTPGAADDVQRYIELLKESTKSSSPEIELLREKLNKQFAIGESEYEREIEAAVGEVLDRRIKEKPSEALNETTKQQLRNLFRRKDEQ